MVGTRTNSKNKVLKIIKILYIINLIPLLPCVYLTLTEVISRLTGSSIGVWSRAFLGFTLLIVFLRIFFLPYILSFLLSLAYLFVLIKCKAAKREIIVFLLMLLLCVLGLLSVEKVFWAAMGV